MTYPRWTWLTTFPLALTGLGLSIYLSIEHATSSTSFACPESATINCVKVTTSKYSTLAGVPVAYLGLAFFIAMVVLFSPWVWRLAPRALRWVRLASVVAGLGMIGYLVWAELYRIHAICLWCTGVHITTVLLFTATVLVEAAGPLPTTTHEAFKP
ncbi:MAG: putative rane protein [Marmoricola sp.]|nr:putative rane protein [Marmoricola sp.]